MAAAGPDRTAALGEILAFDGRESRYPDCKLVRYEWDFGDGSQGGGPEVTYAYSRPGTYEVTCSDDWEYTVGVAPQVDGAVGSLIHWPLVLILLLGTLPGVVIVADTARRRRKRSQVEMVD